MTDTDWLALADFLDAHANDMRSWTEDEPKFRAAADGLRQYAAITAALGDPDELRYHARGDVADTGGGDDLQARLRAIADAAGSLSPTPTPDHCPTCDSDDVEACGAAYYDEHRHICPDAWHDSQG